MGVAVTTDVGTAQRHNEDGWCAEQLHRNVTLLAVADGFGRAQGSQASRVIIDAVRDQVRRELRRAVPPRSLTASDVRQLLVRAFCFANERLLQLSGGDQDHVAAACTCTAVLVVSSEAFIAHVGDSRLYLARRGELLQLTSDESIIPELVTSRSGTPLNVGRKQLRPLLTRALGLDAASVAPKVTHYPLHAHDALLLCTDGAYRSLSLSDLRSAVSVREQRAEWVTDKIVATARLSGGADNATVMFVRDAGEHGAPAEASAETLRPRPHALTLGLAALVGAAALALSLLWTADTRLYLSSDLNGRLTLYSGSPVSMLGVPLHIARNSYDITNSQLPPDVRDELAEGMTVASPAAAAALVSQWQRTPRH
ncbi:MAG: protein phosphatase 2C domain-containing protein [Candidatus Eremiobacteraeota bacterium]|nr:protein phosphatase 2C domain-containing protein [Candidatus Eremiobacteraeota bacterium]